MTDDFDTRYLRLRAMQAELTRNYRVLCMPPLAAQLVGLLGEALDLAAELRVRVAELDTRSPER